MTWELWEMWKLLKRVERPVVQCHVIHFVFAAHTDSGAALRTVSKLPMFSFSHLFSKVFCAGDRARRPKHKRLYIFSRKAPSSSSTRVCLALWFLKTLPGYPCHVTSFVFFSQHSAQHTTSTHAVRLSCLCLSVSEHAKNRHRRSTKRK